MGELLECRAPVHQVCAWQEIQERRMASQMVQSVCSADALELHRLYLQLWELHHWLQR